MKRLDEIPLWLFVLLTVAAFDGTALAGLMCARRLGQWLGLYTLVDNNTVGWIFSAILVIYAIAIGLIAVATWANSSAASRVASQEASNIAALCRSLAGYPQPLQNDLAHSLVCYTQSVIQDAWPAQQRGEVTEKGIEILLDFGRRILGFEPATDGQCVFHAEALRAFNTLVESRRRRIEATDYAVPGSLWAIVVIGAALSIFASYIFNIQSLLVQALMTTLLASMIALLVSFIAATDHPYRGVNAIRPGAYEIVLRDLTEHG
jgi:hypothetical protein